MTTKTAEDLISDLADALDVPDSRYESADRSYKSVHNWLDRPDSRFSKVNFSVYTQGSFRLGTAIRPFDGREDYDLDIVCEFSKTKSTTTQKQLFDDLGYELTKYADSRGMEPPAGWDRCWTLHYADDAQFHMDVLPCIPDGSRQREIRLKESLSQAYVDKSVSITDKTHPKYRVISDEWPASNPNGYAEWFYERMKPIFDAKRMSIMLLEKRASVSEIPAFRVKTPLQRAIQILKHHRNVRFSEDPDLHPSSIVISTLAAAAYKQEATITAALFGILADMDRYISVKNNVYAIPNPSNPKENFADSWKDDPKRREMFYDWLDTARTDFREAAEQDNIEEFIDRLAPRMGRGLLEKAAKKRRSGSLPNSLIQRQSTALQRIIEAPHRKPLIWPRLQTGMVQIVSASASQSGFRPFSFSSNSRQLPKYARLTFIAETNVSVPFKVYWQIVNTGSDAKNAKGLRGGFEEVQIEEGRLIKKESTLYAGSHSIECFIVKNGYCVARSNPFIVNIG